MIDFSTLQGVTIPEGVVTQIESGGVVLWRVATASGPIVLEVEKITSDTYAGETTYEGESFILLDVYPKTNATVSVTYGGLTKTVTDTSGAAEPNAQQVFFGTFNGVSDTVETPASGTLTIEGDCAGFGVGVFYKTSKAASATYFDLITEVVSLGGVSVIPETAFRSCASVSNLTIPSSVKSIGKNAFQLCTGLSGMTIPKSVSSIGANPWRQCTEGTFNLKADNANASYKTDGNCLIETASNTVVAGFANAAIPSYAKVIGEDAFFAVKGLTSVSIPSGVTTIGENAFYGCSGLERLEILAATPPSLGANALFNTTCAIVVPLGCGEAYKAAENWSNYADRIEEG